jgi:exonuclease VII large subunit
MEYDLWRQWQAFSALLTPASKTGPARDGEFGFAPFVHAAERFNAAARTFLDGAADAAAPTSADAARIFSDFLREQFADFQPLWGADFGAATGALPASTMDSPALGPTREHQQRWQRTAQAWRRIDAAQRRLQRLCSDALREAATAFAAQPGPPRGTAIDAQALHKLYDTWIDCAEQAYARTAHGDAFCDA